MSSKKRGHLFVGQNLAGYEIKGLIRFKEIDSIDKWRVTKQVGLNLRFLYSSTTAEDYKH